MASSSAGVPGPGEGWTSSSFSCAVSAALGSAGLGSDCGGLVSSKLGGADAALSGGGSSAFHTSGAYPSFCTRGKGHFGGSGCECQGGAVLEGATAHTVAADCSSAVRCIHGCELVDVTSPASQRAALYPMSCAASCSSALISSHDLSFPCLAESSSDASVRFWTTASMDDLTTCCAMVEAEATLRSTIRALPRRHRKNQNRYRQKLISWRNALFEAKLLQQSVERQ